MSAFPPGKRFTEAEIGQAHFLLRDERKRYFLAWYGGHEIYLIDEDTNEQAGHWTIGDPMRDPVPSRDQASASMHDYIEQSNREPERPLLPHIEEPPSGCCD